MRYPDSNLHWIIVSLFTHSYHGQTWAMLYISIQPQFRVDWRSFQPWCHRVIILQIPNSDLSPLSLIGYRDLESCQRTSRLSNTLTLRSLTTAAISAFSCTEQHTTLRCQTSQSPISSSNPSNSQMARHIPLRNLSQITEAVTMVHQKKLESSSFVQQTLIQKRNISWRWNSSKPHHFNFIPSRHHWSLQSLSTSPAREHCIPVLPHTLQNYPSQQTHHHLQATNQVLYWRAQTPGLPSPTWTQHHNHLRALRSQNLHSLSNSIHTPSNCFPLRASIGHSLPLSRRLHNIHHHDSPSGLFSLWEILEHVPRRPWRNRPKSHRSLARDLRGRHRTNGSRNAECHLGSRDEETRHHRLRALEGGEPDVWEWEDGDAEVGAGEDAAGEEPLWGVPGDV